MGLQHRRIQQGTMHQPSNGSSTQENTAGNKCINHQMGLHQMGLLLGEYSREQCINHQMGLVSAGNRRMHQPSGNNASTIKWVFNTGEYSRNINHQMGLQHQQGTMHQPSNGSSTQEKNTAGEQGSSTQENTAGTMHQPSNGSSTQENTAGNNASTIKWVFNTGRIQNHQMSLQPSNEFNTGNTAVEQCINHQMGLKHRENTAGNNASTINGSSTQENTAVIMHQPSNESTTQEEYSRNNASTIK
ncbi:WTAP [Mytilus edulis]|uniref:WTAP n=1 Tax=Mytilus edulis TaxID=6550 RepID=A0A8S3SZP3_MYTED|nr:WTAP [Mytilus edulis]